MTSEGDEGSSGEAARRLVQNERAKLTATYVNGIAVGLLIIGVVGPVFSFMFAAQSIRPPISVLAAGILICQLVSGCLHWFARRLLKDLEP